MQPKVQSISNSLPNVLRPIYLCPAIAGPTRKASTESPDAPTPPARFQLPSLVPSRSPVSTTDSPPSVETPSSEDKDVKPPPLSVPKRALPPRKKSSQKQASADSQASIALPPPASAENEAIQAPVVTTPGEVEGEVELEAQPHVEEGIASPHVSTVDEVTVPGENALPTEIEPVSNTADALGADESRGPLSPADLAPIATAGGADPVAEAGAPSPTTALGQNAISLVADDDADETEGSSPATYPVVPEGHIPPALRSQLDEEEEPEEDTWDEEVPPVPSIPPPPPPPLPARIELENQRSETHTPTPLLATRPPVPAALASAAPTSPPLRPVPIPNRSESPAPAPSRQGSVSERPARRSLPPPPRPPAPVKRSEGENEEVEEDESAVGEGAHH